MSFHANQSSKEEKDSNKHCHCAEEHIKAGSQFKNDARDSANEVCSFWFEFLSCVVF